MRVKKWLSIMLAFSVCAAFYGCKPKDPDTSESSETKKTKTTQTSESATESTSETDETTPSSEPSSVATVKDEGDGPLLIYGYDKSFSSVLGEYITDIEYEYVYIEPSNYYSKLEAAFADEDRQPDLFMVDADHLQEYSYSDQTLPIGELGLSSSELKDQFEYTYQLTRDADNNIKGLSYELSPSAIIYNRALAQEYFGCNEPADVALYLNNWDSIIESARLVNINSEGTVKLFSALREISPVFWMGHDGNWIVDDQVQISGEFDQYFMLEEILYSETLTMDLTLHSPQWKSCLNEGNALMFFGSLRTAAETVGFVPGHDETIETSDPDPSDPSDPTDPAEPLEVTGWGILPAPEATYDGGTWLMAASTCDMKASSAEVLRALTMNTENMQQMALEGIFVNSRTVMKDCASDSYFACDFFGGQNPYAILVTEAESIKIVPDTEVTKYARTEIENLLSSYLAGDIETMDEVRQQFVIGMQELFGLV